MSMCCFVFFEQSLHCSPWNARGDGMLEICIESFVGIELRAVAGQVEHLYLLLMVPQPLHGLAVMDLKVVHDKKHLA